VFKNTEQFAKLQMGPDVVDLWQNPRVYSLSLQSIDSSIPIYPLSALFRLNLELFLAYFGGISEFKFEKNYSSDFSFIVLITPIN
jgi:hypothetical protein